jgi:hypothetical protein
MHCLPWLREKGCASGHCKHKCYNLINFEILGENEALFDQIVVIFDRIVVIFDRIVVIY